MSATVESDERVIRRRYAAVFRMPLSEAEAEPIGKVRRMLAEAYQEAEAWEEAGLLDAAARQAFDALGR